MTFTYDLTTPVGKARLFATDTDVANNGEKADFSDEEFAIFLEATGSVPILAAATALRTLAGDQARLAKVVKRGNYGNDREHVYKALLETASSLEERYDVNGGISNLTAAAMVSAPDAVFTTDSDDGETVGTMTGW